MKRMYTTQLIPGMTVAENIFSYNQQLIISRGTVLTDKLITRLELYGVLSVSVDDTVEDAAPDSPDESVTPAPTTPSYLQKVKKSPEFRHFSREYRQNIGSFQISLNNMVEKNIQLDVNTLLEHSLNIIAAGGGQFGVLDMLNNMRDFDDSTYIHCMNVALLSNILATWLKMDPAEVRLATACGLLHDIGKLLIPHDILAKPGKLSEEEYSQVQKHPVVGYQMLLSQNVDKHICNAALMHHERCDGSGYPMHLMENQIDKYAFIVAIADVYDAITAARVYRGPLCPFRAIEIFETEGFQKYHVEYLLTFLENVVNTYIRNRCRLSDGREGDIVYINRDKLSRPVVQCGQEYVDLMEHPDLNIACLM